MDGKSLCGTFARTDGAGVHLVAAISHTSSGRDGITDGVVLAQRQVTIKTSEIAWFDSLLDDRRPGRQGGHR